MTDEQIELLISGIKELGLIPDKQKIVQLTKYTCLLQKWNKVYSLTAIIKTNHIITHHLLDGLTVVPYILEANKIIDIGSGMGVPGIILAIWNPLIQVRLLDSNQKKCTFLKQVIIELGLNNASVVCTRVEKHIPQQKFDIVISRAFASTQLFIKVARHLLVENGYFIAMKSKPDEIVMNSLQIKVKIPGINDERLLLKIENL
ncbi:MAG: rRNA ((527)-N(7))-methyltransferase RsmG [Burkholderiales bacterium]|jgi:16S rRNA (guanine527-N7)-methyltransferase|nr:rRNA ((527)-N(7))-methyltransferase RsmG [Burkholderiales bacterium]MCE3268880.1 rRNA ((527)-N(7))-methyltransferase RsmG [Burkholderiales bacterium]